MLLFCAFTLITACAGQQTAKDLSGLEIRAMLDYKHKIRNAITKEEQYYKNATETINNQLSKMYDLSGSEDVLNRRAMYYNDLWFKKGSVSEYDVLLMVDALYFDVVTAEKGIVDHKEKINELYFSKIEKLNMQKDNMEKSLSALNKLYTADILSEQTKLLKDRLVDTLKEYKAQSNSKN